jgi:heme exporter protein D
MHWNSVDEFLAMGGYALYVWGSFGACAIAMLLEPWLLKRRRAEISESIRRELRAREADAGTR